MRNIFTRNKVFLILLIALCASHLPAQENEIQSRFVTTWLEALPLPADAEFDTPEKVITAFIGAVRDNDVDTALKCFAIREWFLSVTMEIVMEDRLCFDPQYTPKQGYAFHNLYNAITGFDLVWNRYLNLVLFYDDKNLSYGDIIILRSEELKQKIEEFKEKMNKSRLKGISFIRIEKAYPSPVATKAHQAMGVEEELDVYAELSVHRVSVTHWFILVKIKSNWRIISIKW